MRREAAAAATILCVLASVERPAQLVRFPGGLAPEAVKPLEPVAKEVAHAGREEELDELLDVLLHAGMEPAAQQKLAEVCRRDAAKVKKPAESVPSASKALRKVAGDLAAGLPERSEGDRPLLARLILRLDDQCDAAQRALGREPGKGAGAAEVWRTAKDWAREERRKAIGVAVAKAHQLDVEVETGPSDDPYVATAGCKEPHVARFRDVALHGVWPAEKLARVLRESLRALALDRFLVTGDLAVPKLSRQSIVYFEQRSQYLGAVALALKRGKISPQAAKDAAQLGATLAADATLSYDLMESSMEAGIHILLADYGAWEDETGRTFGETEEGVRTGVLNWSSLAYLGARIPVVVVVESREQRAAEGRTVGGGERERALRERLLLLSEAGIQGGRAWLEYLAARREDPPLASILPDQVGRLQGDELLKATFVVEMLEQSGPLLPLLKKLPNDAPEKSRVKRLETAYGANAEAIEAEWREWFVPEREGLAQRLGGAAAAGATLTRLEKETLDDLNATRKRAGLAKTAVDFDRTTSEQCRKHALYLAQNPDQLARWPDAHEEYPDRPAFDPAGAWGGAHSVIAPGVKDGREAIASWMATFYHRLPLLDPGLLRIGFALENRCAVLDAGSFVRPLPLRGIDANSLSRGDPAYWAVVWPPAEAVDVPTRFQSELPEPVPGEDCTRFGYPITFQMVGHARERAEVVLKLHSGAASGAAVPCWFSTPSAPTNPKIAPDDSWCLMPKAALQPGGAYTVTGTIDFQGESPLHDEFAWRFHCGR